MHSWRKKKAQTFHYASDVYRRIIFFILLTIIYLESEICLHNFIQFIYLSSPNVF